MTVAWTDFLVIAAVINELCDAIEYFEERGKKHHVVRTAAEKYREVFKNPVFAKLMKNARTRLKIYSVKIKITSTIHLNIMFKTTLS